MAAKTGATGTGHEPSAQGNTMTAVVQHRYGAADVLAVEDIGTPAIGDDDVLIRMHAAGLNAGDGFVVRGLPYILRLVAGLRRPRHAVRGADIAGTVSKAGANVADLWIAHSTLTRFIKAADPDLMRLNLMLLLFVSFLPFTTAIAATHLFTSNLSFHEITVSSSAERVAVVLFGLNLTLAALMTYLMLRHAGHRPDVAADDLAEEELQAFAAERRSALLLQAGATVAGVFLPLTAVVFYLALSIFTIVDPRRRVRVRARRPARAKDAHAEY